MQLLFTRIAFARFTHNNKNREKLGLERRLEMLILALRLNLHSMLEFPAMQETFQ